MSLAHTDHPLRHWDRTCPACLAEAAPASDTPETNAALDKEVGTPDSMAVLFLCRHLERRLRAAEQRGDRWCALAHELSNDTERARQEALAGVSDLPGLIDALSDQKQCDEDGVECQVSRQAVDEALSVLRALAQKERK